MIAMVFGDMMTGQQITFILTSIRKGDLVNSKNKLIVSPKNMAELVKYTLDLFHLSYGGCNILGVSPNVSRDVNYRISVVQHAREIIMRLIMESPDIRQVPRDGHGFGYQSQEKMKKNKHKSKPAKKKKSKYEGLNEESNSNIGTLLEEVFGDEKEELEPKEEAYDPFGFGSIMDDVMEATGVDP